MITFPPEFVTTKYPGYFWNTADKQLYTIKVSGELRPLVRGRPNRWNRFRDGYRISVKGRKRTYLYEDLLKLTPQVIPYANN